MGKKQISRQEWPFESGFWRKGTRLVRTMRKAATATAIACACFSACMETSPQAHVSASHVNASANIEIGWHGVRVGARLSAGEFKLDLGQSEAHHAEAEKKLSRVDAPCVPDFLQNSVCAADQNAQQGVRPCH